MGVGEGDFCGLTDCNRYRLHSGVKFPIWVVRGNLFRIIGSLLQARSRYRAVCAGGEGRAGNGAGAVGIRIQPDLPATQVCTCVRGLNQLHAAGVQLVCETDRCRGTCCHSHRLRVGAGTVVQSIDSAVCMSNFFHIVSAGGKAGDGNFTAGVGAVWRLDHE